MRISSRENGFTIVEFLIIVVFIGILASIVIPNFTRTKDDARESETKANLHVIQAAIERYAVDWNYYPAFLLGGDQKTWNHWHEVHDEISPPKDTPSNNLVRDLLIQNHYLDSYPQNPFVTDGMQIIQSTTSEGSGPAGIIQPGDGDPRFGYFGTTMGNGLDDPSFFEYRVGGTLMQGMPPVETSLIETKRTLSADTVRKLGFQEPPDGLHYMMGGRKAFDEEGNVITVVTFWPGNFFYRGVCDQTLLTRVIHQFDPGNLPGGLKMSGYILGCYGSPTTTGYDVIRLEGRNWDNTDDCYYRLHWGLFLRDPGIKCGYNLTDEYKSDGKHSIIDKGLPEVSGGGDAFTGPMFPYNYRDREFNNEFGSYQFGAPDGHPDGVILVLTSSGDITEKF